MRKAADYVTRYARRFFGKEGFDGLKLSFGKSSQ
jgi:hypothetical protein